MTWQPGIGAVAVLLDPHRGRLTPAAALIRTATGWVDPPPPVRTGGRRPRRLALGTTGAPARARA